MVLCSHKGRLKCCNPTVVTTVGICCHAVTHSCVVGGGDTPQTLCHPAPLSLSSIAHGAVTAQSTAQSRLRCGICARPACTLSSTHLDYHHTHYVSVLAPHMRTMCSCAAYMLRTMSDEHQLGFSTALMLARLRKCRRDLRKWN
jgi:hypothetical protein